MNNNLILSRLFTHNTLCELIKLEDRIPLINSIVIRYGIKYDDKTTNQCIISEIYNYIDKNYRNEYFYKNTLLNKLIINAHRLKTTTALTEVPIAKSKADFIMINGKAVVYEIKTELDTLERLDNQIRDYYKAFDHVCVVISEAQLNSLQNHLGEDSPVGIYVITPKGAIKRIREPREYSQYLNKEVMFKILNKPEYENIIKALKIDLPAVTPVNYYSACKRIICELPTDVFYKLLLSELKKRNRLECIDFSRIPYALRFLAYFSKYNEHEYSMLCDYLNGRYMEG